MGSVKDEFAEKYLEPTLKLARSCARAYKYPDVEEFESIAVYELGVSAAQSDNPSWAMVRLRIITRLKRESESWRGEQADKTEYKRAK